LWFEISLYLSVQGEIALLQRDAAEFIVTRSNGWGPRRQAVEIEMAITWKCTTDGYNMGIDGYIPIIPITRIIWKLNQPYYGGNLLGYTGIKCDIMGSRITYHMGYIMWYTQHNSRTNFAIEGWQ
jgi:hypothetical protein